MHALHRRLLLLSPLAGLEAWAQTRTLRVCVNETPHPPWREHDANGRAQRKGLDFLFLDLLEKRSGLKLELALLPWKRCLSDLKSGEQDLVFGMSFLTERIPLGIYPMHQGQLDERLALRHFRYHWYVRDDSPARWDGKTLSGLGASSRVGVQPGFSIGAVVQGMGLPIDEVSRSTESLLGRLVAAELPIVALQTEEAERVLRGRPVWQQRIRRLEPLIQERAYYAVFSRRFWAQNQARALALWQDMAAVRGSQTYLDAERAALGR